MEKIQAKDLTPEYVIEKLKDTHPLFKYGTPEVYSDSSSRSYDLVSGKKTSYPPEYVSDTQRSKDLLFNYLRQARETNLAEMTVAYVSKDNLRNQYSLEFNSRLGDLIVEYRFKRENYKIARELEQIDKMLGSDRIDDEMDKIFAPYKRECAIHYLFIDSSVENCIRLQAVLHAPTLADDVDTIFGKYIPNLKVAADMLRDLYESAKDKAMLDAAEYIDENLEEFREKVTKFFNEIDYRSIHDAKIDICDVELDPTITNLNVSVSKVDNLTQEEYEDPIMSNHVLLRLLQLQYSLERLLERPIVTKYSKSSTANELLTTYLSTNACWQVFMHVSDSKYAHTTQKLLYNLNARLKNSKAKTREREILKTFKSQTAPIITAIKEIYADIRPYVQPRSQFCVSEELERKLKKDVNTGAHMHTQEVIDKITNAIIETKALCDGYNEEYRRMLDAIAEDL